MSTLEASEAVAEKGPVDIVMRTIDFVEGPDIEIQRELTQGFLRVIFNESSDHGDNGQGVVERVLESNEFMAFNNELGPREAGQEKKLILFYLDEINRARQYLQN